ncbi:type II secretion system F family protein, partial [bacterium CPR1]|nr:type II secretion system F family protein [bacterium CPR1]
SWDDARAWLKSRFPAILSLEEVNPPPRWRLALPTRISRFELTVFLRQLETMLSVGIPTHRALFSLSSSGDNASLISVLNAMNKRVEAGWSLSQAMGEHSSVFSPLHLSLVRTGEDSGRLETCLAKLAEQAERENRLRQRFVSTLTYPAVLGIVCLALVLMFVMFLIPKMEGIFLTIGGQPPLMTRMLVSFVHFFSHPVVWVGALLSLLAVSIGLPLLYRRSVIRLAFDQVALELPVLGNLLRKTASSRLLMAWATLLESGVPIGPQMAVVGRVAGNEVMKRAFDRARDAMVEGEQVSAALEVSGVFPNMVVQMVKVGEESGELDQMMRRLAVLYEDEVNTALNDLASLLEPLVLGVMGCLVGFVAIATALPIINLTGQL